MARKQFTSKVTGQAPTDQEWAAMKRQAHRILANAYAAPEQIEWAMEVLPCGEIESWLIPRKQM